MNNDVFIINKDTLCDIADAIRSKIECGETMCCDFAEMIRSILQGEDSIKHGVVVREYNPETNNWKNICAVGNMYINFQKNNPELIIVDLRGQSILHESSFFKCTAMTSITLPETLQKIETDAFNGCTALPSITIPERLNTLGNRVLQDCTALEEVVWNAVEITTFPSSPNYASFLGCKNITSLTFGPNVISIPQNVFTNAGATFGGHLNIPEGVINIDNYAFYGNKMTKVTIPESVKKTGSHIFISCPEISEVIWKPVEITTPTGYAAYSCFNGCSKITSLTFGPNVKSIPQFVFTNAGATFGDELVIPSSIETIGREAFAGNNMHTVTFEGTPSSIHSDTFKNCSRLTSINVPWSEGEVANAPWGATSATINYNS